MDLEVGLLNKEEPKIFLDRIAKKLILKNIVVHSPAFVKKFSSKVSNLSTTERVTIVSKKVFNFINLTNKYKMSVGSIKSALISINNLNALKALSYKKAPENNL